MATTMRTVRVGSESYPLVLPNLRDPRLHLASVIISVHILGQTLLGFRVSIPQILTAILTCALMEVAWTFVKARQIVWPASAMLTGSGVALIMRLVGMERGQHWTWAGWHLFALVAAGSLLTKYAIRAKGSHLFNPSNVGLVVAFLLLGSGVIEPLDFWWAPWGPGLVAAYLLIVVGGLVITSRLALLSLASAFWITLALGLGVLSASGHCITAAWAIGPVCGFEFWRVVMTSPELLIFLFFMITDPKTVPTARVARTGFAIVLGVVCALLMAFPTTEFGAKVGLLAGLVVLTPTRFLFDRYLGGEKKVGARLLGGTSWRAPFLRGAAIGVVPVLAFVGVVAAGAPAREAAAAAARPIVNVEVDASLLPPVTVSDEVRDLNSDAAADPGQVAVGLAEALAIENAAMVQSDTSLLRAATDGQRLLAMEREVETAAALGRLTVSEYAFASLDLEVAFTDGPQGGANLALAATGEVTEIQYDSGGNELARVVLPFETTFVLSPAGDGRWLIADQIDSG
jgi:hypothetical protein